MRNQFDRQLNTLNGELIQMGHMVEQAIEHAIEAMVHQDAEKARQNMEFDSEVDQQEKDIETLCMKLLMKQQPVARDLRLISAALKMITDMERIGDQAADISELALCLVNEKELPMMDRMKQMSQECMLMVMKALEAFVAKDIEMAKKVIARDDVIDAMFDDTKKEWHLSPAYDLTYSFSFNGEHATTINGEGKNPTLDDILAVAKNIGLKEKFAKDIVLDIQKECSKLFN